MAQPIFLLPAHDVLGGIARHDLALSFKFWIVSGFTSIGELEECINSLKNVLPGDDAREYPGKLKIQPGKILGVKASFTQMRCLLRYLPFALQKIVSRHQEILGHASWRLVLGLNKISRMLSAFAITESQISQWDSVYKDYLKDRMSLGEEMKELCGGGLSEAQKKSRFGLKPKVKW